MERRWQVLSVVCVGVFIASLDLFIVNIAFPDIQADFAGTDLGALSWVLNAYAIVFAALLVPAGRLADAFGRKRVARKRAGAKIGWYIHATVFVLVNAMLFGLSTQGWGHRTWRPGPMVGWGVGLALHWVSVFVLGRGSALREGMVNRERERIERAQRDAGS